MKPSEIIRNRGFTQGALAIRWDGATSFDIMECRNGTGPLCAVGAIYAVTTDAEGRTDWEAFDKIKDAVKAHLGLQSYQTLPNWNDQADRTAEEVIAAFEGAGL